MGGNGCAVRQLLTHLWYGVSCAYLHGPVWMDDQDLYLISPNTDTASLLGRIECLGIGVD
jgi:hypothetical protein